MNINDFFDNEGNVKLEKKKSDNSNKGLTLGDIKKECHKEYLSKISKFVSSEIIDMTEYTFFVNFLKLRGSIVDTEKFHVLLSKIYNHPKTTEEDKKEFHKDCSILFKHIYDLFGDKQIDTDHDLNVDYLVKDIEEYNKNNITFTKDQRLAIKNICHFLYDTKKRTFGLYGFAGTGKTTTITKLIHYLLYKKYINSIVFTAPTNKAVNVIKSKFRSDLDDLVQNKLKENIDNTESLDDVLYKLEDKGFKVNFLTIHKLLNYQNDFDIEGERVFIKGDKAGLENYDLIVVDETSMIPFQIVSHLFEEANKKNIMSQRIPKIIFVGDPAQLPPVNERISITFANKSEDFDFDLYKKSYIQQQSKGQYKMEFDKELIKTMENKFNELKKYILNMDYVVLKQVMRSNDNKVIGLCNEIRASVLNEIKTPMMSRFKGSKVYLYKYDPRVKKIDTDWFKRCIEYFGAIDEKQHLSNIILTWTNKQSDEYNDTIRKTLYKKNVLEKFEIGDILILTDFYNMKETEINEKKGKKETKRFYTSEQVKVTDIEKVIKAIPEFTENLPKKITKIKNTHDIEEKYVKTIKLINKGTKRKYNVWKLFVHKLADVIMDTIPETHQIYVIDDNSSQDLKEDRKFAADKIRELRSYYKNLHKENLNIIDSSVIRPLWKELNKKLVDPFANLNLAASISIHRSQGSSFYNVFIDADDILKNKHIDEAKRCLYTACTRVSNELHLLI